MLGVEEEIHRKKDEARLIFQGGVSFPDLCLPSDSVIKVPPTDMIPLVGDSLCV